MGFSPNNVVACVPVSIASSTLVKTGAGVLRGIFISSVSGGSVTIYDNASASGTPVVAQWTPPAVGWYQFDMLFQKGCYISIGNTITGSAMIV